MDEKTSTSAAAPPAVAGQVEQRVRPLDMRLRVLRVLLAPNYREHYDTVSEALRALEVASDSRRMFVARLESMQKNGGHWLTVTEALAMLDDCDMLAQRPNVRANPAACGRG